MLEFSSVTVAYELLLIGRVLDLMGLSLYRYVRMATMNEESSNLPKTSSQIVDVQQIQNDVHKPIDHKRISIANLNRTLVSFIFRLLTANEHPSVPFAGEAP